MKRIFKNGDIFMLIVIGMIGFVALSLVSLHSQAQNKSGQSLIAVITVNGMLVKEIDLNEIKEPQIIKLGNDAHLTILAEHGRIKVEDADCPDKICVNTGWLTKSADMAVCLPNKVFVTIK